MVFFEICNFRKKEKNTLHGVVNFTRMSISKKKGDVVKTYMCVVVAVLRV
jgi:hypothetical protein